MASQLPNIEAQAPGESETGSLVTGALPPLSKAMEDEVCASLGALLGTLEVLAMDSEGPLSARQKGLLGEALRWGDAVRAQVEALLTLLSDERDPRFAPASYLARRLVDHAVRAASWSASEKHVSLALPAAGAWENEALWIDAARTDRTLRAVTDALIAAAGENGRVELTVTVGASAIRFTLRARRADGSTPAPLEPSRVLRAAWERVLQMQGGKLSLSSEAACICVELPKRPVEDRC